MRLLFNLPNVLIVIIIFIIIIFDQSYYIDELLSFWQTVPMQKWQNKPVLCTTYNVKFEVLKTIIFLISHNSSLICIGNLPITIITGGNLGAKHIISKAQLCI